MIRHHETALLVSKNISQKIIPSHETSRNKTSQTQLVITKQSKAEQSKPENDQKLRNKQHKPAKNKQTNERTNIQNKQTKMNNTQHNKTIKQTSTPHQLARLHFKVDIRQRGLRVLQGLSPPESACDESAHRTISTRRRCRTQCRVTNAEIN